MTIDNCTSSNYSVVSIVCKDRKGLIYDLMRTLKDIHVRVAYAKIKVQGETAEVDLFVEEADGQRVKERSVASLLPPHSRAIPLGAHEGFHHTRHDSRASCAGTLMCHVTSMASA